MKSVLAKKLSKALAGLSRPQKWAPERYRRIGLTMHRALKAAGYTRHDKHGDKVLQKLAENTHHLTAGENQRPSTYFYLCLQIASDLIPDQDFEIYREHQLSWSQIRKILCALGHCRLSTVQKELCASGHCGLAEAQTALRTEIRDRLNQPKRDGFTAYMDGRISQFQNLKKIANRKREAKRKRKAELKRKRKAKP